MYKIGGALVDPKQRFIKEFTCDGCGENVQQKELTIPIGPRAGEKITANYGCRCADIKLAEEAIKIKRELMQNRLFDSFQKHSIINQSLKTASFRSYKPPTTELGNVKARMMEYAKNFDKEKSPNLLLVGDYGTGKSHLAAAVTKELMNAKYTCLFLSVPKLITKIKESYDKQSNFNEADILNIIADVDLFVLDDLGTEYTNLTKDNDNWTHTKLFEVLDSRSGKPTIYTTNLTGEQLREKVNSRNLSRILDQTEVIEMKGPDYRMKGFASHA